MSEIVSISGVIPACVTRSKDCKHICCQFNKGNYIVTFPGEWEAAAGDKSHMEIIDDDYLGGKKTVCTKQCREGSFKPLDCSAYPLFPALGKNNELIFIRGSKCPLLYGELNEHRQRMIETWSFLLKDERIREWVKKMELVGYIPERKDAVGRCA